MKHKNEIMRIEYGRRRRSTERENAPQKGSGPINKERGEREGKRDDVSDEEDALQHFRLSGSSCPHYISP